MRRLDGGIISCIGHTPLINLNKAIGREFHLYAKLEGMNPGGSLKDRPAFEILRHGIETGEINENTVIVEATSGNMGIGLAQICRYLGLRCICVIDSKTTASNQQLLRVYGAEVEMITEPDLSTGDLLQARINRAQAIVNSLQNSFWVNQYSNIHNALAHRRTMEEIMLALNRVDFLFCPASSCGTLRGCADYLRERGLHQPKIVVADSPGSVIFKGTRGKRLIPGHGAGVRPSLYQNGLADRCIQVTDLESVIGCRRLLSTEALLVGGSSGATFMAVSKIADEIPPGSICVMLFPDRGDRYLDTIFSDSWVAQNLGCSSRHLELLEFEKFAAASEAKA